jgi:tetratricopeptide (TPR) repeat protein
MNYAELKFRENINYQTKLIEEHKNGAEPYLSRADSYAAARMFRPAIADFDTVIGGANAPNPIFTSAAAESACYSKAALLQVLGYYQQALVIFAQIKNKDPESEEAWFGEGVCYNKLGKYQDSLNSLNKAIELSQGLLPKAFEIRAQVHLSLGHRDEATKDLQSATKLKESKPENLEVKN